jgi:hypothetical protein
MRFMLVGVVEVAKDVPKARVVFVSTFLTPRDLD